MSDAFDGDHWGPGFDEEVKEGWTDSESEDEEEEVLTPSSKVKIRAAREEEAAPEFGDDRMRRAQEVLRELARGAYWKGGGEEISPVPEDVQGWRQLSTGE